jgi:class 3 adenylate cyclase/tetratricopeptide (TPR) repeat protein
VQRCPDCNEENPERFRLCGYCGAQLTPPAAAEEVRKTVTIVFCDLKGSTSLGEQLDSESLREVLSVYFDAMRKVLERHGGTVEKFIGDAIMAVFGLPRLHEDDALRAVRAAFEMRLGLEQLNVRLEAGWGVRLQNRTGVNTGEVVAGDTSTGQRLATGDTVNVAARLEQAAPDNEVLIGETTYRLVRDAVVVQPVEPLELKGKAERVPAYRLLDVAGGEAISRRVDLPIVGRDAELAQLDAAFRDAVSHSRCRVVTVVAHAGLGKSRLVEEFVRRVDQSARVLRGRCLSYGQGISFWPLAEALRQAAGIVAEDAEEEARAKLLELLGGSNHDATRRIESLMGLSSAVFGKDELLWAVRAVLDTLAERGPLVVIFDDIHWAEQILLDTIEHVADTSAGVPLLVLAAARHELVEERSGFLAGRPHAERVELRELSPEDMETALCNLTGDLPLPQRLQSRILSVAGGNPLFLEQMVAMLADSGVIREGADGWELVGNAEDVTVPANVASLLSARLDRLGPMELGVVERAAVIGAEFEQGAVAALAPEGQPAVDLAAPLTALCTKRLIRPASLTEEDDRYAFSNLLVRDAAYERLLKRTRARMHERLADWLVEISGSRLAEVEEIVGYHLEQAFRYREALGPVDEQTREVGERAARHLAAAGGRASDRGDMPATATLLQRAARLLVEHHETRPLLLLQAGDALTDIGDLAEAQTVLNMARDGADLRGDETTRRSAELALLHLRYTTDAESAVNAVVTRAREMLPELEAASDHRGLARAWRLLTYASWTATRFGEAAEAAEQTIRHSVAAGDELMARRFVGSLAISVLYGPTPADEAIAYCQQVMSRAVEDRKALALAEVAIAHLEAMRGNFDAARVRYRRSRAHLEEFGWRLFAALTSLDSAPVEMLAGDLKAAERELRRDYHTLEEMGERNYISTTAGLLADTLYRQGRYGEAREFAGTCKTLASDDDVASQFLWRSAQGRLLARDGDMAAADLLLLEARELIERSDWVDWQANAYMDLAEIRALAGRNEEAVAALNEASARFAAKGNVVSAGQAAVLLEGLMAAAASGR